MSTQPETKTATVSEMIHRFRTAPPTSRAIREAMRQNMDGPSKMWYEDLLPPQFDENQHSPASNIQESVTERVKGNKSNHSAKTNWRYKFKDGL